MRDAIAFVSSVREVFCSTNFRSSSACRSTSSCFLIAIWASDSRWWASASASTWSRSA